MILGFATRDWAEGFRDDRGRPTLGASGHYRVGLPAKALEARGVTCFVGRLISREGSPRLGVLTWAGHQCFPPVIVLQRWMNRGLDAAIRDARRDGQVVIQDVDDWFEGLDRGNRAWWTSHPGLNPEENRAHYLDSLRASDLVVCSTPFLADRYRGLGCRTALVRNRLDLSAWWPQEVRERPPTLGWVGAIPWRSAGDLAVLRAFLGVFCRRHGLSVVHAGHLEGASGPDGAPLPTFTEACRLDEERDEDGSVTLPGVPVDLRPMRPTTEIPRLWDGIDVALVPLADNDFNRAKSAIAGMSAAAAGVPFVATGTPEYEWLRREHGAGRTASRRAEWVRHLTALLDPEARRADAYRNAAGVSSFGLRPLGEDWGRVLAGVAPTYSPSR